MCGITGWIDWNPISADKEVILDRMVDTLANRGPDDQGKWLSIHAAIGHRRLSVVDPAGGAQPMIREKDGRTYVITYNGELYNTPEIRSELAMKGYSFKGHSDTEVLLYAYIEWGPACTERLNGIFAFAIWAESEQILFMARDRMGVKPLFYAPRSKSLIFASEQKSLLVHPDVKPIIGEEGLAEVLIMGPARTPGHGVFEGVFEVKPGHSLVYSRDGIKHYQYWSLASSPHTDDLETTARRVRELLEDTVRRQLVSDVPVCTLLSGGLDSSAITAFAAMAFREQGMGPLNTYSIDYLDNEKYFKASDFQPNMDAPWVEKVHQYLGTIQHNVIIDTPQLAEALRTATLAKDLPGMADVDSSLYLFCREVKKGATVALSGECADEIFGGYPWFHNEEAFNTPMFPWVRFLEDRISLWEEGLIKKIKPREYIQERYRETLELVPSLEGEGPLEARRREIFFLNMKWFMQTLLDRKDRMSMAVGLEVRVPYADHRLVEYVWNIPWQMKMCDNIGKGILRRALKGILPDEVLYRKKSPYPKTHNPSYTEAVRSQLRKIHENPASPLHAVINKERIGLLLVADPELFNRPFFGQLMRLPQLYAYLIQLNTWLGEYKVQLRI